MGSMGSTAAVHVSATTVPLVTPVLASVVVSPATLATPVYKFVPQVMSKKCPLFYVM